MKRLIASLTLAGILIGCESSSPNDLSSANDILSLSGLPQIPAGANTKVYSWSLMAAGVYAKFDYSEPFISKLEGEWIRFDSEDPLPPRFTNMGIPETPWFKPSSLSSGRYLIRDMRESGGTPESFVTVVDEANTLVYVAYSWN